MRISSPARIGSNRTLVGISQLDRGRSLPPGWQSKVGPGTVLTDTDTVADKALSPGQEIQADRGKVVTPETTATDQ